MIKCLDINIEETCPEMSEQVFSDLKEHLIVVIPRQTTDPIYASRLIHNMSYLANMDQLVWDTEGNMLGSPESYIDPWRVDTMPVQRVTGEKKADNYTGIFPVGELGWHANLNGPKRADGVALQGVRDVAGTVTSWINTAEVIKEMKVEEPDLYDSIQDKWCSYKYDGGLGWSTPVNEKQIAYMQKNANEYSMRILQKNVAGVEGMYFYTNNNQEAVDYELMSELKSFIHQERFMYHHHWEVGDLVLSDQLLTLHRREPYPTSVLEKRVLHRWTFPISNAIDPEYILKRNS